MPGLGPGPGPGTGTAFFGPGTGRGGPGTGTGTKYTLDIWAFPSNPVTKKHCNGQTCILKTRRHSNFDNFFPRKYDYQPL